MLNLKAFFHIHFPQKHHSLSNSYRDTKTTVNILMKKMNSFYEYKEISTGEDFFSNSEGFVAELQENL